MTGSARVRLATFNVLHGRQIRADGRPPTTATGPVPLQPLIDAVTALDADVLALQELDRNQRRSGRIDQARAVAEATGITDWRYASAFHARAEPGRRWVRDPSEPGLRVYGPPGRGHDGDAPSHGIALLSRLPVLAWRARRFSAPPVSLPLPVRGAGRPGLTVIRDHPRTALAAVLDGPRGPFTAVALHLSFIAGWNLRQLLAVHRWIADLPRPHVLLGDLNLAGPIPAAALRAAELRSASPRPGWQSLARVPTFPSHRPRVQLDHILATGLEPYLPSPASAPRTSVSDHRPLVLDLTL